MTTTANTTQVLITGIAPRHPLFGFLSPGSRAKVNAGGLPAELVFAGQTPVAVVYLGEQWHLTGVEWKARPETGA